MIIPNTFYLYWTGTEFTIHQYLCVKSIAKVENPDKIILYYSEPIPNNTWWHRTVQYVELRKFDLNEFQDCFNEKDKNVIFQLFKDVTQSERRDKFIKQRAADLVRILCLIKYGGIYTDFDTLTIKSIKEIFEESLCFLPLFNQPTLRITVDGVEVQSHIASGNLGAVKNHPFFLSMLSRLCKYIEDNNPEPFTFEYNREYELNKVKYGDIKLAPWPVFHSICHKSLGNVDYNNGVLHLLDFFPVERDVRNDICVFHYYGSKSDTTKALKRLAFPKDIYFGASTYSKYAKPLLDDDIINIWEKDKKIISPDRKILEEKIIPNLTGDVCFVGVSEYITHYWELFKKAKSLTTIDSSSQMAKFGCKNHHVCDLKKLTEITGGLKFDYIVGNDLIYKGVKNIKQMDRLFHFAAENLKEDGMFIYGWPDAHCYRCEDPTVLRPVQEQFEECGFLDLPHRCFAMNYFDENTYYNIKKSELIDNNYCFAFFKKRKEPYKQLNAGIISETKESTQEQKNAINISNQVENHNKQVNKNQWKKDGVIRCPERTILETLIIPNIRGNRICFVGVGSYVQHYWSLFHKDCVLYTLDNDVNLVKYAASCHIVYDLKNLGDMFTSDFFDIFIVHGIAGFGTNTNEDLDKCFASISRVLKKNGLLIYGWNDCKTINPTNSPLEINSCVENFELVEGINKLPSIINCNEHYNDNDNENYNMSKEEILKMNTKIAFFKRK